MGVISQNWLLAKKFEGEPKNEDFRLIEEELPPLQDGEFLAKAEYLSVDPYMRRHMMNLPEGSVMVGGQIAKVVESKNAAFPVGARIYGHFGWRTYTLYNPDKEKGNERQPHVLFDFGSLPSSLGLGVLGLPGNTAYFGFLELCAPKEGETVVVSGAAGAVGSIVGQIAKLKGCRVIGIAGSDAKCQWLRKLGFDHAVNYKSENFLEELKKAAPKGVDCYFDNVGGTITESVIRLMNVYGRISVCGSVSNYNTGPIKVLDPQHDFVVKQLKMEGFVVSRWRDRWMEGIRALLDWIKQGKLQYEETVTNGFENMPKAFMEMLQGGNTGKAIVKLDNQSKKG